MGKLWKITIFHGKTMENHDFMGKYYGKHTKKLLYNGKIHHVSWENSLFQWLVGGLENRIW